MITTTTDLCAWCGASYEGEPLCEHQEYGTVTIITDNGAAVYAGYVEMTDASLAIEDAIFASDTEPFEWEASDERTANRVLSGLPDTMIRRAVAHQITDLTRAARAAEQRAAEPAHLGYPHEDRTLYDCPACERECLAGCPDRDTSCVGSHPDLRLPDGWVSLQLCDTCVVIVANGDASMDGGEEAAAAIKREWSGYHLIVACDDCDHGFTWSACDGCSATGITPHAAVADPVDPVPVAATRDAGSASVPVLVAVVAALAVAVVTVLLGASLLGGTDAPTCPRGDSCAVDYRDGAWFVDGQRVTR